MFIITVVAAQVTKSVQHGNKGKGTVVGTKGTESSL